MSFGKCMHSHISTITINQDICSPPENSLILLYSQFPNPKLCSSQLYIWFLMLLLELCITRIILCVLFSLVQHNVSETQPCFSVSAVVSFLLLSRILLCGSVLNTFIPSLVEGLICLHFWNLVEKSDCFHFLAIMSNAAMNIFSMALHSSTLVWKIPWTEEPGRLPSMLRVRHDWATSLSLFTFMH